MMSRRSSEDFTSEATPDVIRSTVLSLIPQLRVSEDKKRALILEVQTSDFAQPSVIEYFIGIVGVSQYEAGLRTAIGQSLVGQVTTSSGGQLITSNRQITGKAYCHGGDLAILCGIDLETEMMINNALFGHSISRKRKDHHSITTMAHMELKLGKLDVSVKFTERAKTAIECMCFKIVEKCVDQLRLDTSKKRRIDAHHLLEVIKRMNDRMELPVRFTERWEQKVIEKIVG